MAKGIQTRYVCRNCGAESPKWLGKCSACDEWGTLEEVVTMSGPPKGLSSARANGSSAPGAFVGRGRPQRLGDVASPAEEGRVGTGISEFDRVLGGGIVRGALVLIGGDPGIGKCLAGTERVLDPCTGDYLPITKWAEKRRPVLALDESTGRLIPAEASLFHAQGTRAIVEVRTRLGRTLRCTPNHPVLTPDGWQAVGTLMRGTRIASPRSLQCFGADSLDAATVRLLAYILSDGSAQSAITITNALPEVAVDLHSLAAHYGMTLRVIPKPGNRASQFRLVVPQEVRRQARQVFSAALIRLQGQKRTSWAALARQADVSYSRMRMWRDGRSVPSQQELDRLARSLDVPSSELVAEAVRIAAMTTPAARILEKFGLRYSRAENKAAPPAIFRLPRPQLALFLKVLFSCDGSVYLANTTTPGLSYSTISRQLAQDVQHLLLRFGFSAKLRTKQSSVRGAPSVAHEIQMLGVAEVRRFLTEIGIWGREAAKQKIAALPLPTLASTHFDTVPVGADFWRDLREAAGGISFQTISRQAGVTIRSRRFNHPLCRKTITALADAYPAPHLRRLIQGDILWDEISEIIPAGEEPVFDITVPGAANFVASDLIVHNSTLLTQVAGNLAARDARVLYVSGEESATQIKIRAERLGVTGGELLLHNETDVSLIAAAVQSERPALVIIDSIQTMTHPEVESSPGSVSSVRAATAALAQVAKGEGIPIFLVGHVTKEGALAGPRVLEHMVDTVLTFEGDRHYTYRILRAVKNRFGSTDEIGLFEMHEEGLVEVPNPSEMLLAERTGNVAGSAVTATVEGTRPLLLEVQALVAPSYLTNPRRTVSGVDVNRVHLILAVLEKRVGLSLANQDVFVNIAGGVRVDEPASDLAIAVAAASNFQESPVDPTVVLAGEIGLGGEVRAVGQIEKRLREAARMGFRRAIVCARNKASLRGSVGLDVVGVDSVRQAIDAVLARR